MIPKFYDVSRYKFGKIIRDFQDVLLDRDGGIKKTSDPSDPYFLRTHLSDGLGYWICYEKPVRQNYGRKRRTYKVKPARYGSEMSQM